MPSISRPAPSWLPLSQAQTPQGAFSGRVPKRPLRRTYHAFRCIATKIIALHNAQRSTLLAGNTYSKQSGQQEVSVLGALSRHLRRPPAQLLGLLGERRNLSVYILGVQRNYVFGILGLQ